MFEHLDDPSDVSPDPEALARVLRRARTIRRRRMGTVVAGCLILLGGATGIWAARSGPVHLSTTETAYEFNSLPSPLAIGTGVPTTALVNVVFSSPTDGYALAAHQGQAVLAVTTDGGDDWQVRDPALPSGYGQSAGYPGQFEFIGTTGYLWGGAPEANGHEPLWITDNGGRSWHAASIGPVVHDVSAIGANVWALASDCVVKFVAGNPIAPCALVVEESDDNGASWVGASGVGFVQFPVAPTIDERVELARITPSRAYVLAAPGSSQPGQDIGLIYTDDAGVTWQTRPVPCAGAFDLGAEIAASSTDDLWLLCGSQADTDMQSKELFRSSDGGLSWLLTSTATGAGTPPPSVTQPDALPLGGYIAPFTVGHKNLAVASTTTAWLYPFREAMLKTETGGRTWATVPGLDTAGFSSGGTGNVTFISATQGWICAYGVGLWHTSDGVHWSPLGT